MQQLPDCPATLQGRILLDAAAQRDAQLRSAIMKRSRESVEWWIDYWVDTYDPFEIRGEKTKPLLLYPFQRDLVASLLQHYNAPSDLLIEKTRRMGATWVIDAFITYKYLFEPNSTFLLGSWTEDEVDDGTINSLFGKIDFILRRLPGWMLPVGFDFEKHRKKLLLIHPDPNNLCSIRGKASVGNFGRAGRYSMVFIDEGASFPPLRDAWTATAETAQCRVIASTPKGKNTFYDIRNSGIDVLSLHWSIHPERDQQWYEEEKKRYLDEVEIAQELDINYERSASGVVYPNWYQVPKGLYPYQLNWPLWISIDFGVRDDTALVVWQRDPETGRLRMIDCYKNRGKPIDFYIPFLKGEISETRKGTYSNEDLKWISRRSTWGDAILFGDPAGRQRSQTDARSVIDVLEQDHNLYVTTNTYARDFTTRKRMTELGLRELDVNLPACEEVDISMSNYRYIEQRSNTTTEQAKPYHDQFSHFASAVEYFFVNLPPFSTHTRRTASRIRKAGWQELYERRR